MRRLIPIAALTAFLVWPGVPGADQTTSAGLVQSTEVSGQRESLDITQTVRRVDGQLPPPLTELELSFPPGTRLNAARFPRCGLAKLQARGPAGCVRRARVGSGIVRIQVPFRFPHQFAGTLRLFNGKAGDERMLLLYMRPQAGPSSVLVGRWSGSRQAGLRSKIRVPQIAIPEAVPDSIVRLSFRIGARRGEASFLRAPCSRRYRATARYLDGSVVTSSDRARCD
jgi:hypothetical protein